MHSPSTRVNLPSERGFAVADTEFFLQVFAGIHAAAQGAGRVGADGQFVFADRLKVVHIVSSNFVGLREAEMPI